MIESLEPLVEQDTQIIILGSMPSAISLESQQYYGNKRNHFWPIICEVLQKELSDDYEEKIKIVKENKIGVWDTILTCERKGSLDAAIKHETPNDFNAFFEKYPMIRAVFFNGKKSEQVFKKYFSFERWPQITFHTMPSTSPIPGKHIKKFDEKVESWKLLLTYL